MQGDALGGGLAAEHEQASERARRLGAWEIERRVETVISGIGLPAQMLDREARSLSGGERGRTALARELVAGHDLLLLDENPLENVSAASRIAGVLMRGRWIGSREIHERMQEIAAAHPQE